MEVRYPPKLDFWFLNPKSISLKWHILTSSPFHCQFCNRTFFRPDSCYALGVAEISFPPPDDRSVVRRRPLSVARRRPSSSVVAVAVVVRRRPSSVVHRRPLFFVVKKEQKSQSTQAAKPSFFFVTGARCYGGESCFWGAEICFKRWLFICRCCHPAGFCCACLEKFSLLKQFDIRILVTMSYLKLWIKQQVLFIAPCALSVGRQQGAKRVATSGASAAVEGRR